MLRAAPNVLVETSGIYRQDFIEAIVAALGPERVVFGSGAPQFDPGYEVLRLQQLAVTEAGRDLIAGGNLRRPRAWE